MAEVTECPQRFELERLQPILVAGDASQVILSAEYIPGQSKKTPIGCLYPLGFRDILKYVQLEYQRRVIEFMNYDRVTRSPRLSLDENIDFSSLNILLEHGLDRRCSRVYQSSRAEKSRDDESIKQRKLDAIAVGRIQQEEGLARIKNGIVKWLAAQAVARYPCV